MKHYYCKANDRCKQMNILATTIEDFMKKDPPCKECLVQSMCLTEYEYDVPNEIKVYYEMTIDLCERMNEFINNDSEFNSAFKELKD